MKTKSKLAVDIKSLVLAKSQIYTREATRRESESDEEEDPTSLRKASDADKERKREKMRLKRQLKREAREKSVKRDSDETKSEAINYLHLWNTAKESWCFKKKQQFWLLNNAFDNDFISDADFEILLNYIVDLKGAAKSRLIEKSEELIKSQEESNSETTSNTFERARSILQILF